MTGMYRRDWAGCRVWTGRGCSDFGEGCVSWGACGAVADGCTGIRDV